MWKIYIFLKIFFNRKQCNKKLRIFYGGSKSGNIGGPLVKIQKLKREFPEYTNGFNLVYLLSNNTYLSKTSLNILKKRKCIIGYDPKLFTNKTLNIFSNKNTSLKPIKDNLIDKIWKRKLGAKRKKFYSLSKDYTGENFKSKIKKVIK